MKKNEIYKAYTSQYQETSLENLPYLGDVPKWLSGDFISVGPAQFEVGKTEFNHWFDGFSMLKKFTFDDGKVNFQNRFLHSQQYLLSNNFSRLNSNEFDTYADSSQLKRVMRSLKVLMKGDSYDNCNVNITKINDRLIAMTESSHVLEFEPKSLKTFGAFQFKDEVSVQLSLAHPHQDPCTGEFINVAMDIGRNCKYHIYKISPNSTTREIIHTYVTETPFYHHSFSITPNYIILFKSPLKIQKFKLLLGLPFNKALFWQQNEASFFVVINRADGKIQEIETDPFVCLHSANAYENGKDLILDLICEGTHNPYDFLTRPNLQSMHPHLPPTTLKRYVIDTQRGHCSYTNLSADSLEFPRINYKKNAQPYHYLYTALLTDSAQKFFDALQKTNVQTGAIQTWKKPRYYPGEAIFIAKPQAKTEDEGVLLSIAFNAESECSSLILLDALTMQEMAEIPLSFHLPFGLHGNFFCDDWKKIL